MEILQFTAALFIVLTAYDKFDYAKEAINLGVLDYLNKPFNQKSIIGVVNQAVAELDARRERRRQDLQTKERLYCLLMRFIDLINCNRMLFYHTLKMEQLF